MIARHVSQFRSNNVPSELVSISQRVFTPKSDKLDTNSVLG
jgi:hypothetical protein